MGSSQGWRIVARYRRELHILEILSRSSFYSANDPRLHFGAGPGTSINLKSASPTGSGKTSAIPILVPNPAAVSHMLHHLRICLRQPLLQTRQRMLLDCSGQRQSDCAGRVGAAQLASEMVYAGQFRAARATWTLFHTSRNYDPMGFQCRRFQPLTHFSLSLISRNHAPRNSLERSACHEVPGPQFAMRSQPVVILSVTVNDFFRPF